MKYYQVLEWLEANGFEDVMWVFEHFNTSPGYDREVFSKEFEVEEVKEIGTCSNCGRPEVYLCISFRKPNDPSYSDTMYLIGCTSKDRRCRCEHLTASDVEQFRVDFADELGGKSLLNYITTEVRLLKYDVVSKHYKLFKRIFNEGKTTFSVSNNRFTININNCIMNNTYINIKH